MDLDQVFSLLVLPQEPQLFHRPPKPVLQDRLVAANKKQTHAFFDLTADVFLVIR